MTDQDEGTAFQSEKPLGPTDGGGDDDMTGHNLVHEFARQQARDQASETDARAKREALRR